MDAALASLEVKSNQATADSKVKGEQLIADLTKRRDEFQAGLVRAYFESAGKQIEQQQATFKDIAAAQAKAWREAVDKFHDAASKVAVARRADMEAPLKQMKSDASEAEARLERLKQAGSSSWSVLSAALTQSRKAFDEANQAAWNALRGSAPKS